VRVARKKLLRTGSVNQKPGKVEDSKFLLVGNLNEKSTTQIWVNKMRKKNDMKKTNKKKTDISRRKFIGAASHVLGGPKHTSPSEILRIAGIGCGSHAAFFFPRLIQQTGSKMVALCDVDTQFPKLPVKRTSNLQDYLGVYTNPLFSSAERFQHYQEMLDKDDLDIDAVLIATPDHQHMPISIAAMNKGKHVYCEKDLGVNVYEVRQATQLAKSTGVVTQMGIGNHGRIELRRIAEAIQTGVIGEVTEVNVWCDDEWVPRKTNTWPPRTVGRRHYTKAHSDSLHPPYEDSVPAGLDWKAWLGPAKERPYPGPGNLHARNWRSWWDFGGGRIADIGCHALDWVFFALNLKYPLSAEAKGRFEAGKERAADWLNVKWEFPSRQKMPAVTVNWYDGNTRPEKYRYIQEELNKVDNDGWARSTMFIGTEGILVAQFYPTRWKLFPLKKGSKKYAKFNYKKKLSISPYSKGHNRAFTEGIKAGDPSISQCGFDYSGPLSETVLLGIAAYRTGKKLEWDPRHLKAIGTPEADQFLKGEYRAGWALPSPVLPDNNYPARESI